jgi:HlyD family secretion protein
MEHFAMKTKSVDLEALKIDRDLPVGGGKRRWGWALGLVLLGVGALGFFWWSQRATGTEVQTHPVTEAASGGGRVVLNASGYVVARRAATVSSKITGKVAEVLIEEGMQVEEGQVLARLDDTNIRTLLDLAEAEWSAAQAARAETQANLERAQREWHRIETLGRTGIASDSELDRARAEVESLQARLELQAAQTAVAERAFAVRRQELEDTVIRAPFAGMATAKNAQPGEMISPISAGGGFTRTGIGTIVDMRSLEIEVEVNESYLQRVQPGQPVEATLDAYPDWRIPGRVIAIIPTADRQKATVKVRVGFDQLDPRLLPEMGVKVAFMDPEPGAVSGAVVVPRRALRKVEGRDLVWVVEDGRVEHRPVILGILRADQATVSQGLTAGERVVVESPRELPAGARVRERPS